MIREAKISNSKAYAALLASFVAVFSHQASWAAEYTLSSALKIKAQHDDNINLEVSNQNSLYGETLNPSAGLQVKTESWATSVNADLRFSNFNRNGYDSDDQYIDLISRKTGERYSFSLQANATHDTTRTSEALDSGRISNERRKYYSLTPSWTYSITDQHQLTLSTTLSTAEYNDERYTGYENGQAYAEWAYIYAENLRFFLRANASDYESDGRRQRFNFVRLINTPFSPSPRRQFFLEEQTYVTKTNGIGFQLGANYQVTEKLAFFGLFGSSETDTNYDITAGSNLCDITASDPSWIVRGACTLEDQSSSTKTIDSSITWKEERQTFVVGYNLQTQPSSDGFLLEYNRANLNWNYKLSQKNNINISAVWGKNKTLDKPDEQVVTSNSDREFQNVTVGYNHRFTKEWSVNLSYRYRYQERKTNNTDATGTGTGGHIAISYRPQAKQWSR